MWARLLERLGRGYRNAAAIAAVRRTFNDAYPEAEATAVWRRAREADRDVVAVLYRDRDAHVIPGVGTPRYKLFAIRRHDLAIEELPRATSSPYLIRGIK